MIFLVKFSLNIRGGRCQGIRYHLGYRTGFRMISSPIPIFVTLASPCPVSEDRWEFSLDPWGLRGQTFDPGENSSKFSLIPWNILRARLVRRDVSTEIIFSFIFDHKKCIAFQQAIGRKNRISHLGERTFFNFQLVNASGILSLNTNVSRSLSCWNRCWSV